MHRFRRSSLILSAFALLLFGFTQATLAQNDVDPPDRVARLNFLRGNVSFLPADGDQNAWVDAVPNRPLTTGDRLWADRNGRAELHIGSTALRIDANTGLSFLTLGDNAIQLQLSAGSLIVRVRRLDPNDTFEIETPNLAFDIQRPGTYRISVNDQGNQTIVIVRQGFGVVTGGGRSFNVQSDQQAMFTGTEELQYDLVDADYQQMTEFDRFAADRDTREDHIVSTRYVSPEVTGYEDLDGNGDWDTPQEYGTIWYPRNVPSGWAPYRFGHWVWIFPWTWTWVDDMPWGFAPFHYGRWVQYRNRWGWVPGPIVARPSYCPALVAWVGGGPGVNFSVSVGVGGGIAWFPLAPREVFVPNYRVSDRYVTRVNITNTVVERTTVVNIYHNVNVTNITYVNQRAQGGVTVVSHDTFVNARPVGRNIVRVPENELQRAPITHNLTVEPEHNSRQGAGQPTTVHPPEQIMNRPVVTQRGPLQGQQGQGQQVNPRGGQQGQQGQGQQGNPRGGQQGQQGQGQQGNPRGGQQGQQQGQGQGQGQGQQGQGQQGNPRGGQQGQQQQQQQNPPGRGNEPPPQPIPPQQQQVPPPNPRGRGNERPPEQAPPEHQQPPPPQQQQVPPQPPPRGGGGGGGQQQQQQQLPPQRPPQQQTPPPVQPPPPVPVKQAPPVHQPSQQDQANERAKQAEWEKTHARPPQPPPPQPKTPPVTPPPPPPKKDDKNKGRGGGGGSDH